MGPHNRFCSPYDTTNWIPSASLWQVCLAWTRTRDGVDVLSETGTARRCKRYQVFRVRLRKMAGIRAASSCPPRHAPIMTLVPAQPPVQDSLHTTPSGSRVPAPWCRDLLLLFPRSGHHGLPFPIPGEVGLADTAG
jgi:hypothetical protein